jgi:hypothetical protein
MKKMTEPAYCPTCRRYFKVKENPPYAVMHIVEPQTIALASVTVESSVHRHPITYEILEEV